MPGRDAQGSSREQSWHRLPLLLQLTTPYADDRIRNSTDDRHGQGFSSIRRVGRWPNQKGVQADSGLSVIPSSA